MPCRWWPIWYLLFFCHGAEGQLQWVVKEKVTAYGQNLILFCPVENCCNEPTGWYVGTKSIIVDVKTFSNDPKLKYHGTYNTDGFGVVIRNLSEADLNVTYHCVYGSDQSTPKYLLDGDIFRENVPDKDKEIDTIIVVPIVVTMVVIGLIIGIVAYCVYRSRIKKKRQKQKGTDEEMEDLNPSDIQMENQKECFEVEIIQKGPITVGYGATIKINANIISKSTGSLQVNWQKTHNNCSTTLNTNCIKYSGSSCDVNNTQLVINKVVTEDAGIYKLEVISPTETKSSPGILLELHGDEANSLSKEANNFVRLFFLCEKIATQAVRIFFNSKVPEHTLKSFLNQHKSSLLSPVNTYRCTKDQEAKLFPGYPVVVASADFDFTLLYKLIRSILTAIDAPTCGWGNRPLPSHIKETDDIERIRYLRNCLAHNSKLEICDTDFSTHWTDLSQAIDRLSKGSLSTDIESMRTKIFDKCIINEMEKDIRKELKEIQEEVNELQRNFNTRHIPLNIQECHIEQITKWKIEDELFYDETGGFTAVLDMVKSTNYMTIIGGPGSGKTATARHIALQLQKKDYEVVPVCRLEKIIQYGYKDHKQVFVLDDVLGIFALDMNFYNYIISHQEQIFTTIGKTSKVLFTCRKSVYKEAFELGLFVAENVIDLQSEDNQLTETEKMAICQYHCKAKGVSPDLYASLSFTKANHMFPFLCKVFSSEEKYQQLGESFFNKPFGYFISELDKLQHTNAIQYAVLILCLINDSKLLVECLPHERMQEVFNNCRVNRGTSDEQIRDAIYHMSETYFSKLDTEYTFTHDFIFEALSYHYGRQNQNGRQSKNQQQQQILKYLSSSYIANKVTVYEQASNEDLCIHLREDMYLPLAERLYTDIQSMNLFDVFMNKSLKHGPFLAVFEGMLRTIPFDEFESLILRKCQNIHHFLNTIFSEKEPLQQIVDIIEFDRLHVLFGTIHRTVCGSEHTCNVRVISWIINYGHTHLLQEIVNHVERNNHSTSLIFGSDVMENTRLLLLGCYSNTLDIVELILKYVDPKCIDTDLTFVSLITRNVTPLIAGCMIGKLCIVNALLRNRADINKCNNRNTSPLFTASSNGHIDVVECLLSSGADINLSDTLGQSPLFAASLSGHCDVVKCLLRSGAQVNLCDIKAQSPLFLASMYGHCDVVKCLLNSGAKIALYDENGQSPLFLASMSGHCDVVKCLLSSDAKIDLCDRNLQTPLFLASMSGHCDVVKCLLSYGATIDLCDNNGQSPLFLASRAGHCDVVKCLLNSGANSNLYIYREQPTSSIAFMPGELNVIKYSHSFNVANTFHHYLEYLPLFVASHHGHCDVVKYLLRSGADINLCDVNDQSPLFHALMSGHCDVVKCLLNSGADVNLCDTQRQSPLFIASMSGYCDIVQCLLSSGAKINLRDKQGQTPLFLASRFGHCDVVKYLLSSGSNINLYDEGEQSPLFVASHYGHYNVVQCLLSSCAEINLRDFLGKSPLFVASHYGHYDVVQCLLSSDAEIHLRDFQGKSPLFVASHYGHYNVVQCLLSSGAEINLRDKQGQSPLFIASMSGHLDVVKTLLSSGAEINMCDGNGHSPLFIASSKGEYDVARYLLSSGANINLRNAQGQSPFFIASMSGNCDVVKYLLSSGAEINMCDGNGQSPLFIASSKGEYDVARYLLSSGADINLRNAQGQSPFFIASMSGHLDVVKTLLSSGAEINRCDGNGQSPLFIASSKGECGVVKYLLSSGADINLRNEQGQSPLFRASQKGKCNVVKCLLSSDAEIDLCNNRGHSPLFIASHHGHCDIVQYLLSFGADVNLRNEQGQSPLFIASMKGRCNVVKCLLSSGAEINLCDKQGKSPLVAASWKEHCDVAKCLISSGADINLRDEDGHLPMHVALSYLHSDRYFLFTTHEENV